jgi:phage-related holin
MKYMNRLLELFSDFHTFLVKIISFIIFFLIPISNYVHLIVILIGLDLITGCYAAIKEGERFSARKLRNTIEKFIFYAIAIIVGYILQQIIDDGSEMARLVAFYIGATESTSIYENISRITKVDIVSSFVKFIREKLQEYLNGLKAGKNEKK